MGAGEGKRHGDVGRTNDVAQPEAAAGLEDVKFERSFIMESEMDFNEWWAQQPKDPTKPITPRMAWEAATRIEREACAKLCDERASREYDMNFDFVEWDTICRANELAADAIRIRSNEAG